jgi:hypothetical protein
MVYKFSQIEQCVFLDIPLKPEINYWRLHIVSSCIWNDFGYICDEALLVRWMQKITGFKWMMNKYDMNLVMNILDLIFVSPWCKMFYWSIWFENYIVKWNFSLRVSLKNWILLVPPLNMNKNHMMIFAGKKRF